MNKLSSLNYSFLIKNFIIGTLVIFAFSVGRNAYTTDVIIAKDGTQSGIQSSIDSLAGAGVVIIPCGIWEFNPEGTTQLTKSVFIPYSNVTILGCGANRTILMRQNGVSEAKGPFFLVSSPDGEEMIESVRISGLTIIGNISTDYHEWGIVLESVGNFRIDHCRFEKLKHSGVQSRGTNTTLLPSYGVVDHCNFVNIYKTDIELGYGVAVQGNNTIQGEPFGSHLAAFIEDSSFSGCRHAVASNQGGRYVFRHNHVTNNGSPHGIQAIDAHGHEHPALPTTCGTEWIDVYENIVENPSAEADAFAVLIRGGKGLVWNNTFRDYTIAVMLWEKTDQETGPVYVWGNTLPGGIIVSANTTNGASPTYHEYKPSGYLPYPYPHPLVADMTARAGPDQNVIIMNEADSASIFIDGSHSTVEEGHSIERSTWYLDGEIISSCMHDIIIAGKGRHYLLLELERDDGLKEYDLAIIDVSSASEIVSSPSWNNTWFVPITGRGRITFKITPMLNNMNGYVAVTGRHSVDDHEQNAAIIRTNTEGYFDVRNGNAYQSNRRINYSAGTPYNVEILLDVPSQTYSVRINSETIAEGYSFRSTESEIGQLTAWHATGSIKVEDISINGDIAIPDLECIDIPEPSAKEKEEDILQFEGMDKPDTYTTDSEAGLYDITEQHPQRTLITGGCSCNIIHAG